MDHQIDMMWKRSFFFFSEKLLWKNRNRESIEKQWCTSSLHDSNLSLCTSAKPLKSFKKRGQNSDFFRECWKKVTRSSGECLKILLWKCKNQRKKTQDTVLIFRLTPSKSLSGISSYFFSEKKTKTKKNLWLMVLCGCIHAKTK